MQKNLSPSVRIFGGLLKNSHLIVSKEAQLIFFFSIKPVFRGAVDSCNKLLLVTTDNIRILRPF